MGIINKRPGSLENQGSGALFSCRDTKLILQYREVLKNIVLYPQDRPIILKKLKLCAIYKLIYDSRGNKVVKKGYGLYF